MHAGATLGRRFTLLYPSEYDIPGVDRWVATDARLDRNVHLDIVTSTAPTAVRQTAAAASQLRDPRIGRILSTGRERIGNDRITFIVSEIPRGRAMDEVVARHVLPPEFAAAVVGEAARALTSAAVLGIHHGYLRPGSITVDARGRIHVAGVGVDGELASQSNLAKQRSERSDALALGRLYLAAVSGVDPDQATAEDIPEELAPTAAQLCAAVIKGSGPSTLAEVEVALRPADTRVLRSFDSVVSALPVRADVLAKETINAIALLGVVPSDITVSPAAIAAAAITVESQQAGVVARSNLEIPSDYVFATDLEELDPAIYGPVSDLDVIDVADAHTAELAVVDADADLEVSDRPLYPVKPKRRAIDEDLHMFDEIVAQQNLDLQPSVYEAVVDKLHRRFPESQALAVRLDKAHQRSHKQAPIRSGPLMMALFVIGVFVVAIVAFSLLSTPIEPDFDLHNNPSNTYPAFTFGPSPSPSPSEG